MGTTTYVFMENWQKLSFNYQQIPSSSVLLYIASIWHEEFTWLLWPHGGQKSGQFKGTDRKTDSDITSVYYMSRYYRNSLHLPSDKLFISCLYIYINTSVNNWHSPPYFYTKTTFTLVHICRMDFPIIIIWASPLSILGESEVFFHFL